MSASELINMWLHSQKLKSDQTRRSYRTIGHELTNWLAERYNLPDLRLCTLGHLQFFVAYLKDEKLLRNGKTGMSQNAVAKYACAIRSLWKFGCKESIGYFSHNIAQELSIDWQDKTASRYLPVNKINQIEGILEDGQSGLTQLHYVVFTLLYYSGCRVGEIARITAPNSNDPKKPRVTSEGLFWSDVQEVTNQDGVTVLNLTVRGKGNKTRTIGLDPQTSAILILWRGDARDNEPVFPSPGRKHSKKKGAVPISDRHIRTLIKEIGDKKGIKFSPHFLRHSHATNAKLEGASDTDLMKQLGHTSPTMTARYTKMAANKGTGYMLRR
ncbi:tyrosine-type recombinase/integrase [Tolypothrix sp. VBCCA 56010]|uniref:tyrosine-type recombinase/integrase n=1 Tax=Tolypothrix sp. VBCCA 56010 TaxID=3137731 RepID=UPI003D7C8326